MLFLTILAAYLPATFAVNCFVCSWSPKDAPNRTAMCNDEQFEANALVIRDCENGCQTYVHMDRNGVIEQMRRNCLQPDETMTGNCVNEENKAFSSKRCTCNYNLCNAASSLLFNSASLLLATIFMLHIRNFI